MKRHMGMVGLVGIAAVLGMSGTSSAQYWGWGYAPYYQSSTPQEAAARGMAEVIRAAGEARLRQAEAAKHLQEARAKALENRLRATEVYHERRRIARQARASTRRSPTRSERTFRLNRSMAPPPLGPSGLDPVTGEIHWPLALRQTGFDAERRALGELFAQRAADAGYVSYNNMLKIQEVGKVLQERLKQTIRTVPTGEYIRASKFLKSLLYEPRRQPS